MNSQLRKTIKKALILYICIGFVTTEAFAFQDFSAEDQMMIQQWVNEAGFKMYSANNQEPRQKDQWLYSRLALQALHTSRPEQFYIYLSTLVIAATQAGDDELSQLLQPALDLNKTQARVLETFTLEQNVTDLADWLRHYIDLEKHLGNDKEFYSKLFELLTKTVTTNIRLCPEMLILENFKGKKERRHAILQCITQSVKLTIVDIDISRNRVTTSRIISPEPISTDLPSPSATILDNSEQHFATVPTWFDHPTLKPVVLLTSPLEAGFLASTDKRTSQKAKILPVSPLTESEINKVRQLYLGNDAPRNGHKGDKHFSSWKPDSPHWLEAWLTSPGYSIALFLGIGVAVTLFTAYFPYPGNPWL